MADVLTKVMARCVPVDDCWVWIGPATQGYGMLKPYRGPARIVHRVVYEALAGPIPAGLTLDHLCRNRRCCNPDHLEPVTSAENVLRGFGPPAINARKTHCNRGHELSGNNLRMEGDRRRCRTCERQRQEASHVRAV